jgi:hypothetical protein
MIKSVTWPETEIISVGVDVGKRALHWTATALSKDMHRRIIDYGIQETNVDESANSTEQCIFTALCELYEELFVRGFLVAGSDESIGANIMMIDSGYLPDVIYQFVNSNGISGAFAVKGYGSTQKVGRGNVYTAPKTMNTAMYVGDEFHVSQSQTKNATIVHINSDVWKYRVQESFMLEGDHRVCLFECRDPERTHFSFSKHITSEKVSEVFVEGKGLQRVWEAKTRNNHWLDATNYSYVGIELGLYLLESSKNQGYGRTKITPING